MGAGKRLRSGFTTGACAAAATKGALLLLLGQAPPPYRVEIPFPDGSRHGFVLESCSLYTGEQAGSALRARASVIKDAGDDPDVTNGAEIFSEVTFAVSGSTLTAECCQQGEVSEWLVLRAGDGVGTVTRPGLPVPPGRPAINPGPVAMIRDAVSEAFSEARSVCRPVEVTISVKDGEMLAQKTLNGRLGIRGGISILGTTGIVRPVSAKAWTDTIEASMSVARAAGLVDVLLSTGRTSERHVQALLGLPEEAQVMMGDYLAYSLRAAARHGFKTIHLAGMWAKVLKAALEIPQTHVRNGALEVRHAVRLLKGLGLDAGDAKALEAANTAREIYERLVASGRSDIIGAVCERAREFAERESGLDVKVYLVTSEHGVVHTAS